MIKFYSKVKKIEQRKRIIRAWKEGDNTRTEEEDMGWFMLLDGSWEALYVGREEPGFQVNEEVEVLIRHRTTAD